MAAIRKLCFVLSILTIFVLAGCSSGSKSQTVLGVAYGGPVEFTIRKELAARSPEAAKIKHGERLEILGRRRVFYKVRTEAGIEGWVHGRQLLSASQMEELNKLAERAGKMPSHGAATVYDSLNVHTEAHRQASSFYQIQEGEHVDVLEQAVVPRGDYQYPRLLPPPTPATPVARERRRREKAPTYEILPVLTPPAPPKNWLELSKTPELEEVAPPPKPVPRDTWALVRLTDGRAGWVLARMLRMDIPDEVAQYSEGHRITSYFSMGEVKAGEETKHNWLWTTLAPSAQDRDFDSFRYFIWNVRRNRYETAYIERNLKGYFPVEVHTVEVKSGNRTEKLPGFSLVVEEKDGLRYRRTYAYQVYLVRLIEKVRWEPPPVETETEETDSLWPDDMVPENLFARWKNGVRRLFNR